MEPPSVSSELNDDRDIKPNCNWNCINQIYLCSAIAGTDFCVIAADTRVSQGYSVLNSEYKRSWQLTDKCVLTSSGMVSDMEELAKIMKVKVKVYERNHGRQPDTESLAEALSH